MNRLVPILVLILFLLSIVPTIPVIHAATRTIDGDPSDWTGTPPATDNTYTYDTSAGEWIWKDAVGDINDYNYQYGAYVNSSDLVEFRISGDTNYLYILYIGKAMSENIGDNGALFLAITIDRDRVSGSGEVYFAGNSETQVNSSAAWEYQIVVNLADSRYTGKGLTSIVHPLNESTNNWGAIFQLIEYVSGSWNHVYVAGDTGDAGLLAVNIANNAVEIKINWSLIGGMPDNEYIRFEVMTANGWSDYANNGGGTWDTDIDSDAVDTISNLATLDEVNDGIIDYYFDVYFVLGEPSPPPPPTYKVYGYVTDQYGNPVAGATVELDGTTNTTDANGYYEIHIASGTYTLRISKPGYETFTTNVYVSGDTEINATLWKFAIDTSTNTNDFPAGSQIYVAETTLTATGNSENALKYLYVTWDTNYLYIGVDWAPGTWSLALGIGIDANPATTDGYSSGTDSWGRSISFSGAYIDYEAYFWYDGSSITSVDFNKYEAGSWTYDYATIYNSPVASGHDGSTLFKVAIPWSAINSTTGYNGTIVLVVWITGGSGSAVSALPLNPDTLTAGSNEWSDSDTIYMYVSLTVDQDSNGAPDTGVTPNTRAIFYPSLTTILTTDSNTYSVAPGGTVSIIATLTDENGYPLPDVTVYVTDGITTLDSKLTDLSGQATLQFTAPSTTGTYTYTVAFDGHAGWSGAIKTITVNVVQPQYKVYGYVTDKDTGAAVVGAKVEILDPKTLNPIATNTTGSDGYYEIYLTSTGTFFLRVNKTTAGYAIYVKKITVTGDTRIDVPLEKYLIDLTTNANDFPANAFVYTAQTQLTPILEGAKHNLSRIYIAWDTEYLYIGTDFAPEDWWVAYGIAIDVNPGNASTGYGAVWASNNNEWNDCWQRKINQSTPILPDHGIQPIYPELITYFWYQGTDGITAAQINRYKYETYSPIETGIDHWVPWEYGYATPKYSPVATTKDGSTLFKVAIPWSAIQFLPNITYTGEIALVVWVAHGDHSSALSVLPNNPLVFDAYGWDELSDTDVMYMYIKITYDSDKDYVPDDVAPNSVTTFYPTISTTIETDKDVYEVGSGQTVEVKVKVRDAFGNYLAAVRVELYDSNGHFVTANLTTYNTNDPYAFTAVLRFTAPLTKGVYNYTVKFVGEAGFLPSEKNITVNVTRSGTRIVGLTYDLIQDFNGDGLPSAGDVIQIKFKLEGYNNGWQGLPNKPVIISLQYKIHTTYSENISTVTGTDGYVSYDYTIPADMVGADLLTITAIFEGDDDYAPTSASTTAEVNIARVIDGNNNDWGTGLPRSTPGIAPRGDEIVITDPANDIHMGATGVYTELDIKEVRITYDGLYLYFYVKFTGSLTKPDEFTVNVAIDASPDNPADGVSEWLYGYWFTDIRLGGFTGSGKHIDVWRWTHIVEAVPIENKVNVYSLSGSPVSAGKLAVNTAEGFIEFAVPVSSLEGLDPTYGFRVWITVFGVPSTGKYVSLTGANAIDVAGVGNTNLELLTYRDPNWGNLTWPSEDIWVDTAFTIKFKAPSTPDIPDPSPDVPPTTVDLLYIIYNGTLYKPEEFTYNGSARIKVMLMVYVQGTQGRPVNATVDTATYTGVAGADDIALIPVVLPEFTPSVTITTTSDGLSDSVTIQTGFRPPPMPEPLLLPLLVLIAFLLVLLYRKKK